MKLFYKPAKLYLTIYDITYSQTGDPEFLVYLNGKWLVQKAQMFTPEVDAPDITLSREGYFCMAANLPAVKVTGCQLNCTSCFHSAIEADC